MSCSKYVPYKIKKNSKPIRSSFNKFVYGRLIKRTTVGGTHAFIKKSRDQLASPKSIIEIGRLLHRFFHTARELCFCVCARAILRHLLKIGYCFVNPSDWISGRARCLRLLKPASQLHFWGGEWRTRRGRPLIPLTVILSIQVRCIKCRGALELNRVGSYQGWDAVEFVEMIVENPQ